MKIKDLAEVLRAFKHKVFDFTDATHRDCELDGFVFNASDWSGKPLEQIDWIEFMQYSATKRAYHSDKAGLDWSEATILLLPSGRSSHIEAGYSVGKGKPLFILGDLPLGDFDTMYGFAECLFRAHQIDLLCDELRRWDNKIQSGTNDQ